MADANLIEQPLQAEPTLEEVSQETPQAEPSLAFSEDFGLQQHLYGG